MRDLVIGALARVGLAIFRAMVLYLPDRVLGKIFRMIERLVYAATGAKDMSAPVGEVADIFETGPPFTVTVRKMMREAEPELLASVVKCLARPSPYGAV